MLLNRSEGGQAQAERKTERLRSDGSFGSMAVKRAAELLRAGGTVAFPTETVYGLGANALDAAAVGKIFAAKERPGWDPLIVHASDRAMVEQAALLPDGETGQVVEDLMLAFWPGPLTLLLPRTSAVPDVVTAGRPLVGVRIPALALARELIRQAGVPIAAPSANRFGHTSPTNAAHVLADLDGRIDAVLDGGSTTVGVESTVVGMDGAGGLIVYRPGGVTVEMLERVCGAGRVSAYRAEAAHGEPESLPSPGVAMRHYAPRARLLLVRGISEMEEPLESRLIGAISSAEGDVGVMLPDGWDPAGASAVFRWGPWWDADTLARLLFAGLRMLDDRGVTTIICPLPEMGGLGEAMRDRLEKAAKQL